MRQWLFRDSHVLPRTVVIPYLARWLLRDLCTAWRVVQEDGKGVKGMWDTDRDTGSVDKLERIRVRNGDKYRLLGSESWSAR